MRKRNDKRNDIEIGLGNARKKRQSETEKNEGAADDNDGEREKRISERQNN